MQTLISVFDDRSAARRAMDRLVQAGFSRDDVHLQQADEAEPADAARAQERAEDRELGNRMMNSAEREVAVDRNVFDSIGHFFVSIFGQDKGEAHAKYSDAVRRGRSVVVVDAENDQQAETAAVILHEQGAVDVDDHHTHEAPPQMSGVHRVDRTSQPPLRELLSARNLRADSLLADRPGSAGAQSQVREGSEDRAYASDATRRDREGPGSDRR